MGDFLILLESGYSRRRAFVLNTLSSLTAMLGAILAYFHGVVSRELHLHRPGRPDPGTPARDESLIMDRRKLLPLVPFVGLALCIAGGIIVLSTVASSRHWERGSAGAKGKCKVFVSIPPQEYFVERVGGGRVDVEALLQPGDSPATYEPTPRQIAELSEAALYFRIGVAFENALMPKIRNTMTRLKVVDTRKGIELLTMKKDHHPQPAGENEREPDSTRNGKEARYAGKDPHIWLDPMLVKIQVRTVAASLAELDPDGKDVYNSHCEAFAADLDGLNARLTEILRPVKGKTLMVFHPAWGYFAHAYGFKQEPIEIEGKTPSARQLVRIIEAAREERVKAIFVQPQFSRADAEAAANGIGGKVVPIDPLARDYMTNLEYVAATLADALSEQK